MPVDASIEGPALEYPDSPDDGQHLEGGDPREVGPQADDPIGPDPLDDGGWLTPSRFIRALGAVTVLGLAIRVGFVLWQHWDQRLWGDAFFYHHQAKGLLDGKGFAEFVPKCMLSGDLNGDCGPLYIRQSADHPPLFTLFLAAVSLVGFTSPNAQLIAIALVGSLTTVFVGLAGRRIAGPRVGLVAAIGAAIYANIWLHDGVGQSESLALLLCSILVWRLVVFARHPTTANSVWLGVIGGFAALTRAEVVVLLPLALVPLAWRHLSGPLATRARYVVTSGVVMVAIMAPWVVRNMTAFEKPLFLSGGDGITMAAVSCDEVYYGKDFLGWWSPVCIADRPLPADADASIRNEIFRERATEYISNNQRRLPVVLAARLGRMWGLYRPGNPFNSPQPGDTLIFAVIEGQTEVAARVALVQYYLLIPAALGGAVALWRRRRPVWIFLVPGLTSMLVAMLTFGNLRYRAPFEISLVLMGAVGLVAGFDAARRHLRPTPEPPAPDADSEVWDAPEEATTEPEALSEAPAAEVSPYSVAAPVVGVEGLRALAALAVLVSHVAIGVGWTFRNGTVGEAVARGDVGVSIFFVLSGFLLSLPMIRRALVGQPPASFTNYAIRRAARIYPAYWVALFVVLLVGWWLADVPQNALFDATPIKVLAAALLVHTYHPSTTIGPIGPAWSLATELSFYLVLPLLIGACWRFARQDAQRFRRVLGVLLAVMLVAAPIFMGSYGLLAPKRYWGMFATWLPAHLDEFAVGMGLAWLRVEASLGRVRLAIFDRWTTVAACMAVAVGAYVGVSTLFGLEPNHLRYTAGQILPRHWSYLIIATALLVPIALGSGTNRFVRGVFDHPVAQFLGRISYGIYLWQLFVLGEVMEARGEGAFAGNLVIDLVLTTALTIVVATVSYYALERPAQRVARRIIAARAARAEPTAHDREDQALRLG